MDPKDAVVELMTVLKDNPDMLALEYYSKETGMHVRVERPPLQPKKINLPLSPN